MDLFYTRDGATVRNPNDPLLMRKQFRHTSPTVAPSPTGGYRSGARFIAAADG
jgi:hypothetical protein